MKQSAKIVFFGNERLATGVSTTPLILTGLVEAGYDVVAVVLHQSDTTKDEPVAVYAQSQGIQFIYSHDVKETTSKISVLGAEIGVLAAFGQIIPIELINIFPRGIINLHPSKLPEYRGPTPVEQTIVEGKTTTFVSIMSLGAGMDSGPVYAQKEVSVPDHVSKQDLSDILHKEGAALLLETLPKVLDGTSTPVEQDHEHKTICRLLTKQSGTIDWDKSAVQLEREVRAFAIWPKSRTTLGQVPCAITSAHITSEKSGEPGTISIVDNELRVATSYGSLVIDTIQPDGKKEMPVQAFLNGYRNKLS